MFESIRFRLTFWHFLIFASLQGVLGVGIYLYINRDLSNKMDRILTLVLDSTALAIRQPDSHDPDGSLDGARALRMVHHIETPIVIYGQTGEVLSERPETVSQLTPMLVRPQGTYFTTIPAHPEIHRGDRRYAIRRVHDPLNGRDYFVAASISLSTYEDVLKSAREAFLLSVPAMLLLTILGGWRLTGRSLAPAVEMAEKARSIGSEDIGERLLTPRPQDEFGRLAAALNALLDRLAMKSVSQRQFMADAAHEIRTPLSVIQTAVSVSLLGSNRSSSELRETMAVIDDYVQRLTRSVNDVFRLARSDAGFKEMHVQSLYLDELLGNVIRAGRLLALPKSLAIELAPMQACPMKGDETLLHEMLLNLIENSIKYTLPMGRICVSLCTEQDHYEIAISDTGVGIDASDRDRIFQRFYRGSPVVSRDASSGTNPSQPVRVEGTGLGLAIARWIAVGHHGSLELKSSNERGSTFLIRLPVSGGDSA